MITTLEISNFQSHKNSEIEFDKGLNIITGASDAGKSAVIRALLWVITNRPSGDAFQNWDSKDPVRVGIQFDDDWIIKERKNGKNHYELESGNLEAVRSDVPDEIQNITRITDYNIQTQHQPYFLLQDSPGEVAKKLNELVGLDVIDRLYKNINSRITDAKSRIKFSSERISDLETQIENLSYIDTISTIIEKLDTLIAQVGIVENRQVSVRNLIGSVNDINSKIESQKKILKHESKVKELRQKIENEKALEDKYFTMKGIVGAFNMVKDGLQSETEWLAVEPKFQDLSLKLISLAKLENSKFQVSKCVKVYKALDSEIKEGKKKTTERVDQYLLLLKKHKVCPTCGTTIGSKTLTQIEEGFR